MTWHECACGCVWGQHDGRSVNEWMNDVSTLNGE